MLTKEFYRAFEDKHRGSRELIKERVSVYLPFVLPLKEIYPDSVALDIGCGRGEWLELLKENNIPAKGIDSDGGMLAACHEIGLDVTQGNGIEYLKEQPNESFSIISAFHVVEHISFEDLQSLVQEALRALKPGGILIMETPNPENIRVSIENFYLDPTHIKPIPSNLLSFLPEFYSYVRTKVLRLQESKELYSQENINLIQVVEGVSPDYAVVAQKEADAKMLKQFDDVFAKDYGLSLNSLADKFENRLLKIEAKAIEAEAKAIEAEAKAIEAEAKAIEAEAKAIEATHNYQIIMNSNSWKITKPLREVGKFVRWFITGVKHWVTFSSTSRPRRFLKQKLVSLKHRINAHPRVKMQLMSILNHFPQLKASLKRVGQSDHHAKTTITQIEGPEQLSPRAKKIYNDLKQAIESQQGKK